MKRVEEGWDRLRPLRMLCMSWQCASLCMMKRLTVRDEYDTLCYHGRDECFSWVGAYSKEKGLAMLHDGHVRFPLKMQIWTVVAALPFSSSSLPPWLAVSFSCSTPVPRLPQRRQIQRSPLLTLSGAHDLQEGV
jgi:hypothetical protein